MKRKALLAASLLLVTMLFLNGCAQRKTQYDLNDQDGYCVSIKYDANGGYFADNTTVITDSYNISEIKTNEQGKAEIALLSPDNELRGKGNYFMPSMNDHFLIGWYSERTEVVDDAGNVNYTYSGYWDFEEDKLALDPGNDYTSTEPQLTLYAVWAPVFQVEFYDVDSNDLLGKLEYNPQYDTEIAVPTWSEETGTIDMEKFPINKGYTFNGVYYDKEKTMPVVGDTLTHPGVVDYATASVQNTTLKLYTDWLEGDWYHIYNAKQFRDNAKLSGHYILYQDLDFTGLDWPTSFIHRNFTGSISSVDGETFSIKNVDFVRQSNKDVNAGLFGSIADDASIRNVSFDNISFTINGSIQMTGANFGLFAGIISDGAKLDGVTVVNSKIKIQSDVYISVDDYSIGLICGMGDTDLDYSGITCEAIGENPEAVTITADGDVVTLEIN